MIFDTHAHYDDEKFAENGGAEKLLDELFCGEVKYIINAGTNLDNCTRSMCLSERYEGVYFAAGIHPSDCFKYEDIDKTLDELEKLLSHPKCVALGEIGLDYHYDFSPRETQKVWFERQLCLAEKLGKPVVIHDRDAHGDCVNTLLEHNAVGVMHSCSESLEDALRLVKHGYYISFSGSVTFKNAKNTVRTAAGVPDDRLLVETDSPYLAPTPVRGSINNSSNIKYIAARLAEIRNTSYENICDITLNNAKRLFFK